MFDKSYTKTQYNMLKAQEEEKNINYYQDASYGDFPLHSETVDKDGIGISDADANLVTDLVDLESIVIQPGGNAIKVEIIVASV